MSGDINMGGNNILDGGTANFTTLTVGGANIEDTYVPYTGATGDVDLGANKLQFGVSPSASISVVSDELIVNSYAGNLVLSINDVELAKYNSLNGDYLPGTTATFSIGDSSNEWKDLYLSGKIDLGTNTIADADVGNWNTAYGWGDHASAGYWKNDGTATATGDWDIGGYDFSATDGDFSGDLIVSNQALIGGVTSTVSVVDLGTGLASQWKMNDDLATTNVVDSVGTNDGTLNGGDNTEDNFGSR